MPSSFKSIKEVFKKERAFAEIRQLVDESEVVVRFYEIFPNLLKAVVPVSCEKKILKLRVENPAWRNELKFLETEIIEKINEYFIENRVNKIRFIG